MEAQGAELREDKKVCNYSIKHSIIKFKKIQKLVEDFWQISSQKQKNNHEFFVVGGSEW